MISRQCLKRKAVHENKRQEYMNRCVGHRGVTDTFLKTIHVPCCSQGIRDGIDKLF